MAIRSDNLVVRFNRAFQHVLPTAALIVAAAAAPTQATATPAVPPTTTAASQDSILPNTLLPEPKPSGNPPVYVLLDLTNNTMVWVDYAGNPTWAPTDPRAVYRAEVIRTGSLVARYRGVGATERRRRMMEPTRVLLSRNGSAADRAAVVAVRGAPGDPAGFPDYADSVATYDAPSTPGESEPHRHQSDEPGVLDPVVDSAKRLPGEIVETTTRSVEAEIEMRVIDATHRILRRGRP